MLFAIKPAQTEPNTCRMVYYNLHKRFATNQEYYENTRYIQVDLLDFTSRLEMTTPKKLPNRMQIAPPSTGWGIVINTAQNLPNTANKR